MRIVCLTWLCALGLATVSHAADSAPQHILKVTAPDKAAYVRLFQMGLDLPEALPGPDVLVVGTDAEKLWLEAQGYTVSYQLRDATRYSATRALAAGAASMGGFRTLSECNAAIDSMVTNYPAIVSAKLNIGTTATLLPLIREGNIRAIAQWGRAREADLPDVPTMIESGFPGLSLGFWVGLWAPAGTPAPIVDDLNRATNAALGSPDMQAAMQRLGVAPSIGSVKDFAGDETGEAPKWADIVKVAGVQID